MQRKFETRIEIDNLIVVCAALCLPALAFVQANVVMGTLGNRIVISVICATTLILVHFISKIEDKLKEIKRQDRIDWEFPWLN
jgi:hypothetical protein